MSEKDIYRNEWDANHNRHDISPRDEQDEWVFDTVKPATMAPTRHTSKRRKLARIPSTSSQECEALLQRLDLNAAPLGNAQDSPRPSPRPRRASSRQSSAATAFRVPSSSTPTARRVSSKQPLGVDLSFGNSPSTVRMFKRVPSGERRAALSSNPPMNSNSFHPNPQASTFRPSPPSSMHPADTDNAENTPPPSHHPVPVTKEALLGRRAYAKSLDPAFQEAHAQSAGWEQREAIARVAAAWATLDQVDPEGELLLLKSMIGRLQGDAKLAKELGIAFVNPATPAKSQTQTSLSGSTMTSTTRIRPKGSEDDNTPSTPTAASKKAPKLVMAVNNPHLKSHHRRRQSAFVVGGAGMEKDTGGRQGIDERNLPGYVQPGMEHAGVLADVLYGRWMEGLRGRWPGS